MHLFAIIRSSSLIFLFFHCRFGYFTVDFHAGFSACNFSVRFGVALFWFREFCEFGWPLGLQGGSGGIALRDDVVVGDANLSL
mgnify:CR=1 FL=1